MKNRSDNNKNGYTIIETMVAVSLFIVIVMISMGALLNANLISNKSKDMRSIMDNLSFVMEEMSRNLRVGRNYRCIDDSNDLLNVSVAESGSNCWGIAFEYQYGVAANPNDQWVYYISNSGRIFKATAGPYTDPGKYVQLTPDEIVIDTATFNFSILGAEPPPGDSAQPLVTIKLVGKITYKNVISPFSLQTSVSQRIIDI